MIKVCRIHPLGVPVDPVDFMIFHLKCENFDRHLAPKVKPGGHKCDKDSSSVGRVCTYQSSCQAIQQSLRYFSLDQTGAPMLPVSQKMHMVMVKEMSLLCLRKKLSGNGWEGT